MKILVSIRSFDSYKGRTDVKHNSWFRLSNRFLEDPDFFSFNFEEKMVWIYILSLASQKNSSELWISADHAVKVCGFNKKNFFDGLKKLKEINCLSFDLDSTLRARYVDDTRTLRPRALHNITDITDITNITNITDRVFFDFENLYDQYPLKKGKSKGLEKLKKEIKTKDDFDLFCKALKNYKADISFNRTDLKYIKHFSTFVNEWRDWIQYRIPVVESSHKQRDETFKHIDNFEYNEKALTDAIKNNPEMAKIVSNFKKVKKDEL